MESIVFQCTITKNRFEFRFDSETKTLFCDYTYFDPESIKAYFSLLRYGIDSLISKGANTFVQSVTEEEWNNFLSSNKKWRIRSINNTTNFYNIECNIEDAIESIALGFGLNIISRK
jgi:hypothetical protein